MGFVLGGPHAATFSFNSGNAEITEIYPQSLNNAGQVVGNYYYEFLDPRSGAFIRSGSTLQPFNYPGTTSTIAYGINDLGQIIGRYSSTDGTHDFFWNGAGFTPLDYPGSVSTSANGINNAGLVVGSYLDSSGGHGFIWNGTGFTSVDYPGAMSTSLLAINNRGQILGRYFDGANGHYFLWDGTSFVSFDLPPELASTGGISGFNDSDQFVGTYFGTPPVGGFAQHLGFEGTLVPEPSSLALLSMAAVLLAGCMRLCRNPQ